MTPLFCGVLEGQILKTLEHYGITGKCVVKRGMNQTPFEK